MRALIVLTLVVGLTAGRADARGTPAKRCGTKPLHGERLAIRVVGDPIPCARARAIVRGPCDDVRPWTCIGLRAPDPIMVWLRYSELFQEHPSSAIEARRPRRRCSQRRVTRRRWRAGRELRGYPTLRQMLADDLVECHQLDGMRRREVRRLLSDADESDKQGDDWLLGDERQLIRIDGEFLSVTYTAEHHVERVEIVQG